MAASILNSSPTVASNLLDCKTNTELFSNINQLRKFAYPRAFQTDGNQHTENRQLSVSDDASATNNGNKTNTAVVNITVTGVPDGVSPLANRALIPPNTTRRLYVFSDAELDTEQLDLIDTFYGRRPYPNFRCDMLTKASTLAAYPKHNFYMRNDASEIIFDENVDNNGNRIVTTTAIIDSNSGCPTMSSSYIEYRHLQQRHMLANICFNPYIGAVYRLVLPERPMLCIIMPQNFIRTGPKQGFFRFDNNLIVRVYSRFLLTAAQHDATSSNDADTDFVAPMSPEEELQQSQQQHPQLQQPVVEVTVFSVDNIKTQRMVRQLFGRFGLHKIDSFNSNHMFAYDKYLTMIVGSIANIELPTDYNSEYAQYHQRQYHHLQQHARTTNQKLDDLVRIASEQIKPPA